MNDQTTIQQLKEELQKLRSEADVLRGAKRLPHPPAPKPYEGAPVATDINNFLRHMEDYLDYYGLTDIGAVRQASLHLTG